MRKCGGYHNPLFVILFYSKNVVAPIRVQTEEHQLGTRQGALTTAKQDGPSDLRKERKGVECEVRQNQGGT